MLRCCAFLCGQDPTNEKKRLYKVFESITNTTHEASVVGTEIRGTSDVSDNKAAREAISEHLVSEAAELASGLAGEPGTAAKAKPNRKTGKKELTEEQKAKKKFDKDVAQILGCVPRAISSVYIYTFKPFSCLVRGSRLWLERLGRLH